MAREQLQEGVWLDFDDQVFAVRTAAAAAPSARGKGSSGRSFSERPVLIKPVVPAATETGAARVLADRLVARGQVSRASATLGLGASVMAGQRKARAPQVPTRLTVPLAPGEQAVVLVEGDGVLAWRYGSELTSSALAGSTRGRAGATRALVFDLGIPPVAPATPGAAAGAQRGWLRDRLVEGVKAIVLYFAAEAVASGAVRLLERSKRNGPVVINSADDPGAWLRPDTFSAVALPKDRPARVLLWVHGTFSSTVGGFGELTATRWGQRLLTAALGRYDAVLGFDHRTLSLDPMDNARAMLAALATLPQGQAIDVDAVCHSRGGLVLRSFTEQLLPGAGLNLRVRRAIFVAATNHGTELARPENWETLVDLVTNLSAITSKVLSLFPAAKAAALIGDEVIDALGDFVKYLVEVAVKERRAPGVAAMDPGGEFVRQINLTQPKQPTPQDIECYAIVSDFYAKLLDSGEHEPKEMPKRLAFILADGVIDRLMRGSGKAVPNDLVVDVASMTDIDAAVGGFVKDVLDFGRNPLVYHTNYFMRPETAGRVAQWLRLPSPLEGIDALQLAGAADTGLRQLPASASVAQVRAVLQAERPDYLVFSRPHPSAAPGRLLQYAVRPEEFLALTQKGRKTLPAVDALGLRETERSQACDAQQLPFDGPPVAQAGQQLRGRVVPAHAHRLVVMDGERATGVLDAGSNALNMEALAGLSLALGSPPPLPTAGAEVWSGAIERSGATRGGGTDSSRILGGSGGGRTTRGSRTMPAGLEAVVKRTSAAKKAAPEASSKAQITQTFVTAEMPRQTRLGKTALLSVTLSAEQIEAAAGMATDQGSFKVSGPITVHVVPRQGFDYLNADPSGYEVTVDPPRERQPQVLDFKLQANEIGAGEVMVAMRQGAVRLLTLTLRSTVVAAASPGASKPVGTVAISAAAAPGPDCGACATLEIFDRRNAGELQFMYSLRAGDVDDRFWSAPLKVEPRDYVERRYKAIEEAWTGSRRAVDRFALNLQAIGGEMFRELFPPALQKTLWRLLQAGQLQDILVYSDEPFLPWEVVFLDDPDAPAATGQGRFFGELGLCRWLQGAKPTCAIRVRDGQARHVVPHYKDGNRLAAAEEIEQPMLEKLLRATRLEPSHEAVVHALQTPGSFDLLHFACHGVADSAQIDGAALVLEGELVQTPEGDAIAGELLLASTVAQFANLRAADGNRPLVVVNACQTGRVGFSLTRMGGFAPAFLGTREGTGDSRGRAGAFVGALWSVGDLPASTFVAKLYGGLKQGMTISQASRAGRLAAKSAGEGTWLAYAVYAHPHLRVQFDFR